jgi:predicted DNA-binding transcriptional regulator AlpA
MTEPNLNFPKLMSYGAIAKKLGKSVDTIKRWSRDNYNGFPSPHYLCTSAVFYEAEVHSWLDSVITLSPEAAKSQAKSGLEARGIT